MSSKQTFPAGFRAFIKSNKFFIPFFVVLFGVLALSPVRAYATTTTSDGIIYWVGSSQSTNVKLRYDNAVAPLTVTPIYADDSDSSTFLYYRNVYEVPFSLVGDISGYVCGGLSYYVSLTYSVNNGSLDTATLVDNIHMLESTSCNCNFYSRRLYFVSTLYNAHNQVVLGSCRLRFIAHTTNPNDYLNVSISEHQYSLSNIRYDSTSPLTNLELDRTIGQVLDDWDDAVLDGLDQLRLSIINSSSQNRTDIYWAVDQILGELQSRDDALEDGAAETFDGAGYDLSNADVELDEYQENILAELDIDDIELDQLSDNTVTILQQNQQTTGFWVGLVRSFADNAGIIWTFIIIGVILSVVAFILRL